MGARASLLMVVAAIAALAAGGAGHAQAPRPVTVATVRGGVAALAQDGRRIAWIDCGRVRVRDGSRTLALGERIPGCQQYPARLALAGARALWALDIGGNTRENVLATAALGDRAPRRVALLALTPEGNGEHLRRRGRRIDARLHDGDEPARRR